MQIPGAPLPKFNAELRIDTFPADIVGAIEKTAADNGLQLERIDMDITPVMTRWRLRTQGKLRRFDIQCLLDTDDPRFIERAERLAVASGLGFERMNADDGP